MDKLVEDELCDETSFSDENGKRLELKYPLSMEIRIHALEFR